MTFEHQLKALIFYHLEEHSSGSHLVVVMDKARLHTSKRMESFINGQKRLHVFCLPSYSPDWQPDEQVWNHLKH